MSSGLVTRTFEGAFFDIDGTLVTALPNVRRAWTHWWAPQLGVDPTQMAKVFDTDPGAHAEDHVKSFFPHMPDEWIREQAEAVDRYQATDATGIEAYSGVPEAVHALVRNRHTRMAYVTSGRLGIPELRLRTAGLPIFPSPGSVDFRPGLRRIMITGDHVEKAKPHPEPYLSAADHIAVNPNRCVAFEDTTSGIKAAKGAGMTVVAVTTTIQDPDILRNAGADYVIEHVGTLQGNRVPNRIRRMGPDALAEYYGAGRIHVTHEHGISLVLPKDGVVAGLTNATPAKGMEPTMPQMPSADMSGTMTVQLGNGIL